MNNPFYTLSTTHGILIVNKNDWAGGSTSRFGVSYQLITNQSFEPEEVNGLKKFIDNSHKKNGDGVIVLDCGANIGVHTVDWARYMQGWGEVISIEAQKMIFCSLAGAIALNNLTNVTPIHAVLGEKCGIFHMASPDYDTPGSFGSFELTPVTMDIGQNINYNKTTPVRMISIDSLNLSRLDLVKIDVEGAEMGVLRGAAETLTKFKPVIHIEVNKSDSNLIKKILESYGYNHFENAFFLGNWIVTSI